MCATFGLGFFGGAFDAGKQVIHELLEAVVFDRKCMQSLELLIDNSSDAIAQDVRDGETIKMKAQSVLDDRRSRSGFSVRQTVPFSTCFKCTGNSGIKAKSDAFHSITEMNPSGFASPSGEIGWLPLKRQA